MKKMLKINETINVLVDKRFNRTVITLCKEAQRKILSELKTNEYFFSGVVFDSNYVVVYSRGCMVNQIPLNIEAAYDIREDRMLDLTNKKLKVVLEYMFISKRGFDLTEILTFINKEDLNIIVEEDKGEVKRVLTTGNDNITDEEVIDYILSKYPVLSNYMDLKGPLSVIEYKRIEEELGSDIFRFHLIPQSLKFIEDEYQKFEILACPCNRAFTVSKDKSKEFKKLKSSPQIIERIKINAEMFENNNLTSDDNVLKKIRKPKR